MMTDSPLVSIVMPSYNSSSTIEASIKSIIEQWYKNWELIIVDDRSIDKTWEIINSFAQKHKNIKVYQNDVNKGAGASRNLAIDKAKGRFIAFLDSDDLWAESKLTEQIEFMLKNGYSFTYTYYSRFNDKAELGVIAAPAYTTYKKLMYSNVIGCLTAVYDTKQLGKRYMPLIRKRQDMGLWLDILKDIPKAYCLSKPLAKYRVGQGMSANKFKILSYQWRFYREVAGLGFIRAAFTFFIYAAKGYSKHRK